jgi:hypothetical protein
MIPRSLTVCACCPQAEDAARAATHTALMRIRDATCMFFFLKSVVIGCHAYMEHDMLSRGASHRQRAPAAVGGEDKRHCSTGSLRAQPMHRPLGHPSDAYEREADPPPLCLRK